MIDSVCNRYDSMVGKELERPYICCCTSALYRAGLTYLCTDTIQCWTLYADLNALRALYVQYFFNPLLNRTFGEDCNPSPFSENILEPNRERAIIEGMFYSEYMDEGVLIEGIQNYLFSEKDDPYKLYDLAPKYLLPRNRLDYWINEAREESDMSMG